MMRIKMLAVLWALLAGSVAGSWAQKREVYWGTPNFSYAEALVSPEKLRTLGVSYMSHLLYWNQWETGKGKWNDSYIESQISRIDALRAAGIVSSIRLGEAHPGSILWKTESGQQYLGRNPESYPGAEDTDDRYFYYLRKLTEALKGKIDHYVLGDELDMIFDASFRNEARLREYAEFFIKASQVIRGVDPDAKIVVFPPAWGYPVKNLTLLNSWGVGEYADGISMNISHGDCESPSYLKNIATQIHEISPRYKLYSNGFGYVSDHLPESCQAWRLSHMMLSIWEAGWEFVPYYLLATNVHPWSSGIYTENLETGEIEERKAAGTFAMLAERLKEKPRMNLEKLRIASVQTPFGDVQPNDLGVPKILAYWNDVPDSSFGVLRMVRMNDPGRVVANIALTVDPPEPDASLVAENTVTGAEALLDFRKNPDSGCWEAALKVSNEPIIIRWKTK